MRSKIRVLSEQDINQIAAGEVIEDPSSVVKELVENSIDAGATKIEVEIEDGGLEKIVVRDDGEGMCKDDATLALERHATSKITSAKDITQLKTMGFRGEALPAIASVSRFELHSAKENGVGVKVICHGGKLLDISACGHPKGTTLIVSSLFYNTPARKKFQKGALQLTKNTVKMMTKLALAHPTVQFNLSSAGKSLLKTSRREQKRLTEVLGNAFEKNCKSINFSKGGISIHGFVGTPDNVRANRMGQYLFVNHRAVYSQLVSNAVQSALSTMISKGEHPTFILWCEFTPETIDVNVHPQKKEVRFLQESLVFSTVKEAVEGVIGGYTLPEKLFCEEPQNSWIFSEPRVHNFSLRTKSEGSLPAQEKSYLMPQVLERPKELFALAQCEIVGVSGRYLFVHLDQDHPLYQGSRLVMADLMRIDSLLAYYRLLESFKRGGEAQAILIPESFEFMPSEVLLIQKYLKEIQSIGIVLQPFGKNTFLLDAISQDLESKNPKELILHVASLLEKKYSIEEVIKSLLTISSNRKSYTEEEGKKLMERLSLVEKPFRGPSGDLTLVQLKYI